MVYVLLLIEMLHTITKSIQGVLRLESGVDLVVIQGRRTLTSTVAV